MEDLGMDFLLDPVERLEFGDSTANAAENGAGYVIRMDEGGATSVVATMAEQSAEDDAESVGPAMNHQTADSDAESGGGGGGEACSVASIQNAVRSNGKRKAVTDDGPADSTQSTMHVNLEAPGWTKRVRIGANAAERTPCANRIGALEKSIRSYAEKRGDHVVEPAIGMTFDSLGEAYNFYNLYSWEHGFGIRYGKSWLNPERSKTMQEIVCGCARKSSVRG